MKIVLTVMSLFMLLNSWGMSGKPVPYSLEVITNEKYNQALATKKPLFLAFNADWCPVCQQQNKVLNEVSKKFTAKAIFYTVNWDKKDDFVGPKTKQRTTIVYIKDGKIIEELVGETAPDKIEAFIKKYTK